MIAHIIQWKLEDDITDKARIKARLKGLKDTVPGFVIIVCAVLLAGSLFAASNRQTYRDAQGRLQGTATTDSSGRTTYRDAQGRLQGTKK